MLTRIYIDNFRCFVNFEYKPESKQLLLGENGSGKSSLFDALNYLKRFVNGDENRFTQLTRTRWLDRPSQLLEIEAVLERKKYEYRVEIRFAPDTKQLSVGQEQLRVDDATVFEPSVITSKPAMREQVKTGHGRPSGTKLFYPAADSAGKSVFVRQLLGPHFNRCPW